MGDDLNKLIKAGEEALAEIERRNKDIQLQNEIDETSKKFSFLAKLYELVPLAVHRYLRFECWHTPNYDGGSKHDAQALIEIPNMAPIRIYCRTYQLDEPEKASVTLYERPHYSEHPFEVLDFGCEFDSYGGEYFVKEKTVWQGDDLPIALVHARRVGNIRLEVQEDVDQRNREKAGMPPPPDTKITPMEVLYDMLCELIDERLDRRAE